MCRSLEKEALESSLFEVQQQLTQLEARREQLETNGQTLLLAKETLAGMGARTWGRELQAPACSVTSWGLGALEERRGHWLWSLANLGSNSAFGT